MPHADRADGSIRRLAECIVIASAEHLGFRVHLGVDLEADDRFEHKHAISLPPEARDVQMLYGVSHPTRGALGHFPAALSRATRIG